MADKESRCCEVLIPTMLIPAEKFISQLKFIKRISSTQLSELLQRSSHSQFRTFCVLPTAPDDGNRVELSECDSEMAARVHNVLRTYRDGPTKRLELAVAQCFDSKPTEQLVLDVLRMNRSDSRLALKFFNWVSSTSPLSVRPSVCNEILDIVCKMRQFGDADKVLNEMYKREGFVGEETYRVLVNRYAAAHKVDEAVAVFHKRRELGLDHDLTAFQQLLMSLCRYKHVEVAETLLHSMRNDFRPDIKTLNIILNGWCVLGNVHEAKRFWKDIIASQCKPDLFTFATFIKALTNKGKLGTTLKLYRAMWKNDCKPDVVICNCVIDALCFKKRIPEALEIFHEMKEEGVCTPDVATYNSLIKHLCKIQRMEKVYELLNEMEEKKGSCVPNDITFNYLLKSLDEPVEVPRVLERMRRNGCAINQDTYNLILRLYAKWDCKEKVRDLWREMEEKGLGPDRRSYSIMVHWLCQKKRFEDALRYLQEMKSKGMVPEPKTEMLVNSTLTKRKENEVRQRRQGANQQKAFIKRSAGKKGGARNEF